MLYLMMKVKTQDHDDSLKHYAKLIYAVKSVPRAAQVWFEAHFPASDPSSDSKIGGHDRQRSCNLALIKHML